MLIHDHMQPEFQILCEIGSHYDADPHVARQRTQAIRVSFFHEIHAARIESFEFLGLVSFEDAISFIKGLVAAEQSGASPYPGSVSLVISAFSVLQRRPVEDWAAIADWIVDNHDNPYSPFNFRRRRDQWIEARRKVESSREVIEEASRIESEYQREKAIKAHKEVVRRAIDHFKKSGQVPDNPELRDQMIAEFERDALDE